MVRSWYHTPVTTPEEQCDIVKRARAEKWSIWSLENGLETLIETLRDRVVR